MRRRVPFAALCLVAVTGCTDVRDFTGSWEGPRVGEAQPLRVGMDDQVRATLVVERASLGDLQARLSTDDGRFDGAEIAPVAGSQADALASMTFDGSPAVVFLAFAETTDGGGPATCVIALFPEDRIELRVMRGGSAPLYGIFQLGRQ